MVGHAISAALTLKLAFPRADAARRRELVRSWSADLVRIMGLTVEVRGTPPGDGQASVMIAMNHVSWLDIFVVSGVRSTRFIAKSEVRDWPGAGWIAERAGTLFIRRERRRDTARINELVHGALQRGDIVGLFPEGTTTDGDTLLPFHSSLFEPAVANAAHVYPCAIRYENADGTLCRQMAFAGELSFMQSLGLAIRQRGVVARVSFAPPVDAGGRDRRSVAAAAQDAVASLLGLPSPGTGPRKAAGPRDAPR